MPFGESTRITSHKPEEQPVILLQDSTSVSGALLSIVEHLGIRSLLLGTSIQSQAAVSGSGEVLHTLVEEWTQLIVTAAFAWVGREDRTRAQSTLLVGGGGGVIARALHQRLSVHIVELEPEVLAASQRYGTEPTRFPRPDPTDSVHLLESKISPLASIASGTSISP